MTPDAAGPRLRGRHRSRSTAASVRRVAVAVLLAASLAGAGTTSAAGIDVEPGLWEFTSSIPDPTAGDGGRQVYRTCLREGTITAERVMAQRKECRIANVVVQGPSARWSMRCETPAGPMTGRGSLRSNRQSVAGSLDLVMNVAAFEVPVQGSFRGRRVGPCR